jgi:GNAT superfamily N-acetyltransferase
VPTYPFRVLDLDIRVTRFGAPAAIRLTSAALAELGERYGGDGDSTPVSPVEFDPPDGAFLIAYHNRAAVGCGGWRTLATDESSAELKRMYVVPEFRGRGIAWAVLRAIEDSARVAGKRQIQLETGEKQPEAISLYEKAGYTRIPDFGHYAGEPGVLSLARKL